VSRAGARRVAAIAGFSDDEATARRMLDHPDPAVRATAMAALQRLDRLTADDLGAAVTDPDPLVRRRAAVLAAGHPGVDLRASLTDPEAMVVEAASWAAGERTAVDDATVEALIDVARHHTEPLCREAAIAALGAIGDERGLPAILAGCSDRATVRRRAVIALAPFSGPEVDAALAAALSDRDWQVRQAAEDMAL
jgi:HEAT repeat protein